MDKKEDKIWQRNQKIEWLRVHINLYHEDKGILLSSDNNGILVDAVEGRLYIPFTNLRYVRFIDKE